MPWLITLLSIYVIYCALLFFFQAKLIFPAGFAGQAGSALPTPDTEVIRLATDEGTTTAWLVPAPAPGSGDDANAAKPLVVFFHGNAELIDRQEPILTLYRSLGFSVLLIEYRGYGHSDGTPSQKHIVGDAMAILGDVLARSDIDASRLVLHGRSIGGGMAAQVALQTQPKAIIVESTGTSVASMAWRYGVPPLLVRSPLNTEAAFKRLDTPILIMHGDRDQVFPLSHAYRLDAAAGDSTLVVFDADHNTLPGWQEVGLYEQEVRKHLRRAGVIQ